MAPKVSNGFLLAALAALIWSIGCAQAQAARHGGSSRSFDRMLMSGKLLLQEEESSGNRLKWTVIGAGAGAATGYLLSMPLGPYAENSWRQIGTLAAAAFGALAGLILGAPDNSDRGEFRVGPVSTFIPPSGGIGLRIFVGGPGRSSSGPTLFGVTSEPVRERSVSARQGGSNA